MQYFQDEYQEKFDGVNTLGLLAFIHSNFPDLSQNVQHQDAK